MAIDKNMRVIDMLRTDEMDRVSLGLMAQTTRNKKMTALNKKIEEATTSLDDTGDVEQFLKNVTFNENSASYFKIRVGNDEMLMMMKMLFRMTSTKCQISVKNFREQLPKENRVRVRVRVLKLKETKKSK